MRKLTGKMLAHQHGGNFNIFQLKKSPNSHSHRFFQAKFYDVSGGFFRGQSLAERNGNVVGKTRSKFLAQDVAAGGVAARGGPDLL